MFKYTTSNGFTFSCSVPISGGQAQIDILGKLFRDATDEELYCIRCHMGAFDNKENWNSYGWAVTNFPNVL